MTLSTFTKEVRPAVENMLREIIDTVDKRQFSGLHTMLSYHMGWEGEGAGGEASGKRIRPLLALLATSAVGKQWHDALPAAAAVELIHNFSLIHDDIEDQSDFRHGRKTVWSLWGEAQAINTGDCMFSLAFQALGSARGTAENILKALQNLQTTSVRLTGGQYLDMAYENQSELPLDGYWKMVGGKTAALLACSASIGPELTGGDDNSISALADFAWNLGLAFQAQDDWLGVWGDCAVIGKSTNNDLKSGKKTLPILLGLKSSADFRKRWAMRPFTDDEIPELSEILKKDGIDEIVEEETARLTRQAKDALQKVQPWNDYLDCLNELADKLLDRVK